MDSRTVSKALREEVRPILKDVGFTRFTSRKAWRFDQDTVQVIDFQSLNSYLAEVIGTTTFSFGGHLGVDYLALRHVPWGERLGEAPPEEYHCQARRVLSKTLEQPELPRSDLWYVSPDGRNLPSVIADVARAVTEEAVPWFGYFSDVQNALEAFDARDERFDAGIAVELLGGRPNSAARAQVASALALRLGEPRRAIAAWQRHAKSRSTSASLSFWSGRREISRGSRTIGTVPLAKAWPASNMAFAADSLPLASLGPLSTLARLAAERPTVGRGDGA